MELLDIIFSTLKLFSLSAVTLVAISYFIFKIKDHKRPKPYVTMVNPMPQESRSDKINDLKSVNKIQILNESIYPVAQNLFESSNEIVLKKLKVNVITDSGSKIKLGKEKKIERSDIFDLYASSSIEPMHKIKL